MTEYKTLAGKDFLPVAKKLLEMGQPLPNPVLCVAFVAIEDGDIVAMSVLQSLPVVEPFKAEPGHGQHLGKLFEMTKEFILGSGAPRVLMHTQHRAMQKMLESAGAEEFPVTFYQWLKSESTHV